MNAMAENVNRWQEIYTSPLTVAPLAIMFWFLVT